MNRNDWTFDYKADALATAAQNKADYHETRLDWWEKKKASVLARIRSSGIKITETIVDQLAKGGYSNVSTQRGFGHGPQVEIDEGMRAELSESSGKVSQHKAHIKEYEGWVEVLIKQGEKVLPVTQADWLFFFGK